MGMTLWQKLTKKKDPPLEETIYNPLKLTPASIVNLDLLDLRDKNFHVNEFAEYSREIGEETFLFTDYCLQTADGVDTVNLRVLPGDALDNVILLLRNFDSMAYSGEFDEDLKRTDRTHTFVVTDNGQQESYTRPDRLTGPYRAQLKILTKKEMGLVLKEESDDYWDFLRETTEDGQPVTQYLFIEKNTETGWIQIWKGVEISVQTVQVL